MVRAEEGWPPPPLTFSLTVKYPRFFDDFPYQFAEISLKERGSSDFLHGTVLLVKLFINFIVMMNDFLNQLSMMNTFNVNSSPAQTKFVDLHFSDFSDLLQNPVCFAFADRFT